MFFDVESLSSRTPSTRSDTGAQLNDAFEIDLETTPKELMSSSEDVNSVDAIVQQDESPLPSLHSDSESSVLSLHDNGELYEETNDSGVETSPGSSDKQSQHSPTLISPSVTDNDACVDLAEEPKPGPSQENHCGSIQEKPSVCRVILDDDQDIVECWWYSHVKYEVLMCVLSTSSWILMFKENALRKKEYVESNPILNTSSVWRRWRIAYLNEVSTPECLCEKCSRFLWCFTSVLSLAIYKILVDTKVNWCLTNQTWLTIWG